LEHLSPYCPTLQSKIGDVRGIASMYIKYIFLNTVIIKVRVLNRVSIKFDRYHTLRLHLHVKRKMHTRSLTIIQKTTS